MSILETASKIEVFLSLPSWLSQFSWDSLQGRGILTKLWATPHCDHIIGETPKPCPFKIGLRKFALDHVVVFFFQNDKKLQVVVWSNCFFLKSTWSSHCNFFWNKLLKYLDLTALFLSHLIVILKSSDPIWSNLIQSDLIWMPYPCSPFYTDIKSDIRFDNIFDIRLWNSFHVKLYHKI